MPIVDRIAAFAADMKAWRRDIHQHPETAFEEARTADAVVGKLAARGLEVHRGLAETGVVGLLSGRQDGGRHGLRSDDHWARRPRRHAPQGEWTPSSSRRLDPLDSAVVGITRFHPA